MRIERALRDRCTCLANPNGISSGRTCNTKFNYTIDDNDNIILWTCPKCGFKYEPRYKEAKNIIPLTLSDKYYIRKYEGKVKGKRICPVCLNGKVPNSGIACRHNMCMVCAWGIEGKGGLLDLKLRFKVNKRSDSSLAVLEELPRDKKRFPVRHVGIKLREGKFERWASEFIKENL